MSKKATKRVEYVIARKATNIFALTSGSHYRDDLSSKSIDGQPPTILRLFVDSRSWLTKSGVAVEKTPAREIRKIKIASGSPTIDLLG